MLGVQSAVRQCQPAPKKSGRCPQCLTATIFDRRDIVKGRRLLYRKCGADLTDAVTPAVVQCLYSGLACAYPCGKSKHANALGYQVCERNTPPR